MSLDVRTLLVARQTQPVDVFRAHHAGDSLQIESPFENLLQCRKIACPIEFCVELDPQGPVSAVEADTWSARPASTKRG